MEATKAELQELADRIKRSGGYIDVKVLPDGSIAALGNLITTRAVFLGCNADGWSRRFCFADRQRANSVFDTLQSEDDEPVGYTARRPEPRDSRY